MIFFLFSGEEIKVDESLFQELDDLEIGDEHDPDFDPKNYNSDDSFWVVRLILYIQNFWFIKMRNF